MRKYNFEYTNGGLLIYDGEILCRKKLIRVEKTDSNGRTIITETYEGGDVYEFSCIKNGSAITDVKEYWNGELITKEEEEE